MLGKEWHDVTCFSEGRRRSTSTQFRRAVVAICISLPIEFSSAESDFNRCVAVLREGSKARLRRKLLIAPKERRGEMSLVHMLKARL